MIKICILQRKNYIYKSVLCGRDMYKDTHLTFTNLIAQIIHMLILLKSKCVTIDGMSKLKLQHIILS